MVWDIVVWDIVVWDIVVVVEGVGIFRGSASVVVSSVAPPSSQQVCPSQLLSAVQLRSILHTA